MGKRVDKLLQWFDLRSEMESYDTIHENIESGIVFRGTNLWVLMFAIVVASVGLNMNSTAVIIGAMLISPLMGPINGMGYSLATYDFQLFRRSLKNFSFAVGGEPSHFRTLLPALPAQRSTFRATGTHQSHQFTMCSSLSLEVWPRHRSHEQPSSEGQRSRECGNRHGPVAAHLHGRLRSWPRCS